MYALGIQTLTSTEHMFNWRGLNSKQRKEFGDKLLHQACLDVKYSYFITSTYKKDSRQVMGGPFGLLALMVSGGLQKMAMQHEMDNNLLSEMGGSSFKSCQFDDVPLELPVSESGFDESFTFVVQEKPYDLIDLVVEQDSLVKVALHSHRK